MLPAAQRKPAQSFSACTLDRSSFRGALHVCTSAQHTCGATGKLHPTRSPTPQIQGLPTMIFIGTDNSKPALRTEGLLPAETIKNIIAKELQ